MKAHRGQGSVTDDSGNHGKCYETGAVDDQSRHCSTNVAGKYPEYCQAICFIDSNGRMKERLFPKGLDLNRPRKARTMYSSQQLAVMEEEFRRNQYLVGRERSMLAKAVGISETQVKVWFQNRRMKMKRDLCKASREICSNPGSLTSARIFSALLKPEHQRPLESLSVPNPRFTLGFHTTSECAYSADNKSENLNKVRTLTPVT